MLITARYGGSSCATCFRAIAAGDRISYAGRGLPVFHAACSDEGKEVLAKGEASKKASLTESQLAAIDLPVPAGLDYLPFQKAGIAYVLSKIVAKGTLVENGGCLIAEEMGLGKTVEAIGTINAVKSIRTVLIVCPASLKLNWRNECRKWLVQTPERTLSIGVFGHGVASLRGERFDVTIVSQDLLTDVTPLAPEGRTSSEILHRGEALPQRATWDLVILDEAQGFKNPESQRAIAVLGTPKGKKGKKAKGNVETFEGVVPLRKRARTCLVLTGTPIPNKVIELWPLLQIAAPREWDPPGIVKGEARLMGEGAGFFRFAKRYADAKAMMIGRGKTIWTFDGSSNLPELQERLRATCMVRRLKKDVLKELPPKVRQIIPIGNGARDEEEWGDFGDDYETASKKIASIPFTEISRRRHEQALQKVDPALEHVRRALDEDPEGKSKIIVFAHHLDVLGKLCEGLEEYGVVSLVGDDSTSSRQDVVERFQTDPKVRVFVGSLKAAGVGITLTASAHVVFVEGDWVPATMSQAEDRPHRIGQRENVLIQILVLEGSLDAKMMRFVAEKQAVADLALDDETIPDVSDRPVVATSGADPTVNPAPLPSFAPGEIEQIHEDLRTLASVCDGAVSQDGAGFNGMDSNFGKTLAALPRLSLRQAAAARKMLGKYARQLGREAARKRQGELPGMENAS